MINIKHPGRFHEALGIPAGENIPLSRLHEALHSKSAAIRKMANFARNARKFKHGRKK